MSPCSTCFTFIQHVVSHCTSQKQVWLLLSTDAWQISVMVLKHESKCSLNGFLCDSENSFWSPSHSFRQINKVMGKNQVRKLTQVWWSLGVFKSLLACVSFVSRLVLFVSGQYTAQSVRSVSSCIFLLVIIYLVNHYDCILILKICFLISVCSCATSCIHLELKHRQ